MVKKSFFVMILCVTLCISLSSCTTEEKIKTEVKKGEIQWNVPVAAEGVEPSSFYIEKDSYHITSAIKLEDGIAIALSKKDYMTIIEKTEEITVKDSAGHSALKITEAKKVFDFTQQKRVSQIFDEAAFINIKSEAKVERQFIGDDSKKEDINQKEIDSLLLGLYNAKIKGISYTSAHETEGLAPSGDYKYAAILFIPKVMRFTGNYEIEGKDSFPFKYDYPCVNDRGYLDGMYLLIESKETKNIPD